MNDLKAQGTKAFIWDFTGRLVSHGMTFFVSIILARLLEPSDFGFVAMVIVIIVIVGAFSEGGLSVALVQKRRILPIHYSSVFYFNIITSVLLTLLLFLSAPWIAYFYNNQALIPLVKVISFSFIIGAFSIVQRAKLQKELNYALLTKITLIAVFFGGVVGVSLALYGAGVWSLVALELTQGIVYTIVVWSVAQWKPSWQFSLKALMELWAFGFRMFLSGFLTKIFMQLDTIIIGKLFAPATLGFFNRAKALDQMVINYSSGSLTAVLFPVLSKVQNDLQRFQNIIIKSLGVIVFIVFLLLGGLYLVSHELIMLLFGEKWLQSVDYFKILVLGSFGFPIRALLNNVLTSRGNSKAFLRLEIYTKVILSVNFVVLYLWGINAFLYGLVVVAFLNTLITILFASSEIKLPFLLFVKPIFLQMGITIITVVSTILVTQDMEKINIIMLMIKGSIFTFFYVSLNYFMKTSSFNYFLEQIIPMINKKFRNQSNN
ncbi:MAG TPA: lipopolysaccharide biosynthesis protein [Sulfurovum sp.]|nr:lipopolysaccharide biosynthesis protein [Sulfurovum sp.]